MNSIDQLVDHAAEHVAAPGGAAAPRLQTVVVTCMDARIDPVRIFGFGSGDVHVLRNAGGIVTDDVLRSIAVSQHALGTTAVMVVQHDECGMSKTTDEDFAAAVEAHAGVTPTWAAGTFTDVEASVRRGVARIRDCSFLASRDDVRGFVYDVRTGELREVR